MKRTIFIGFAAAGLLAGTSVALAQTDQGKSSPTSSAQTGTSAQPGTSAQTGTSSQAGASTQTGTSQTGTSGSATSESKLSGKIASVDKDKKMVTISSDTGTQQQLKVGDSTNITRDGSSVSFTQLQSGDEVRASFDPTTKQATTLEVQTKQKKQ